MSAWPLIGPTSFYWLDGCKERIQAPNFMTRRVYPAAHLLCMFSFASQCKKLVHIGSNSSHDFINSHIEACPAFLSQTLGISLTNSLAAVNH